MSYFYRTKCHNCEHDLTQPEAVRVHLSAGGHEFDLKSSVDDDGKLHDVSSYGRGLGPVSEVGLIAAGFHAGSYCTGCDEQLEELFDDSVMLTEGDERWYVKHGATGAIAGPMTKVEALQTGEFVFSEKIFETKSEMTEDVTVLIEEMRSFRTSMEIIRNGEDDAVGVVCQRVIDMLTRLSHPDVLPQLELMLRGLRAMRTNTSVKASYADSVHDHVAGLCEKAANWLVLLSAKSESPSKVVENLLEHFREVAMRHHTPHQDEQVAIAKKLVPLLTELSAPKVVSGSIEGGVLDLDDVPEGVEVDIRDRDVQEEGDDVEEDERGEFVHAG